MLITFRGHTPRVHPSAWIAPTAVLVGRVEVEAGASVMFNCVIRGDHNTIRIGAEANIQDGTVIHCDPPDSPGVRIGPRVSVGHGARLHGCTIGEQSMIGIGAIVLDGATIGSHSLVAAGALVLPGMCAPSGQLIVGVPAAAKRELRKTDLELLALASRTYCELRESYSEPERTSMHELLDVQAERTVPLYGKPYW